MKIVSFLLTAWGFLMAGLGIALLFFTIMTPGFRNETQGIFSLGIGIVAIYYGQLLRRKSKQSKAESDDRSAGDV